MRRICFVAVAVALLAAGCTQGGMIRFGEALLLDRSEPTFEVNAVRPIWRCDKSPDPRYPCVGIGPEGFARDLVARPFANKRVTTIKDMDRGMVWVIRWTWYSMQGTCMFAPPQGSHWSEQAQEFHIPVTMVGGRTFADLANQGQGAETGLTRLSAEKIYEAQVAAGTARPRTNWEGETVNAPLFPPNAQCTAHYLDLTAGKPFSAALWLYAPEADDSMFRPPSTQPSKHGAFETGCREERRNGLVWSVCSGAGEETRREGGVIEVRRERWVARLGDSGFAMLLWVRYREPLFLWPQWYAERRAGFMEVIDSVRVETLPLDELESPVRAPAH